MRKALCFVILLALSFTACAKDFDEVQARQDLRAHYQKQSGSKTSLECQTEVVRYDALQKFSKDDKVEIKIRTAVKRVCTRKRKVKGWNKLLAGMIDGSSGFRPGIVVFQECFELEYERFDEGFKLKKKAQSMDCPESRDFSVRRKPAMEEYLKKAALAECVGDCSVHQEKDINGDAVNELVLMVCGNRICSSSLWSLVNNEPRMILNADVDLSKIKTSTDRSYPTVESKEYGEGYYVRRLHKFDKRRGVYKIWRQKRVKVRSIIFVGRPEEVRIFIDGWEVGFTGKYDRHGDAHFKLDDSPNGKFKITLGKPGYKYREYEWDWDNLPMVFQGGDGGGYLNFNLEKE